MAHHGWGEPAWLKFHATTTNSPSLVNWGVILQCGDVSMDHYTPSIASANRAQIGMFGKHQYTSETEKTNPKRKTTQVVHVNLWLKLLTWLIFGPQKNISFAACGTQDSKVCLRIERHIPVPAFCMPLPFLQCVVLTMHLHCQQSKLILMRQETHPEQGEICRSTSCQQYPHMVVLVLQAHCAIEMKFLVGTVLKQTECWAVSVALFFDEDFSRNLDFLFFCLVVSGSRSWRISTACGKWDPNSQPMLSLTLLQPLVSFQLSTTLPSLPFSCAYCFFK